MRRSCLLLSAPLLLAAAPLSDEQVRNDLRCYVTLSSLAAEGQKKGDQELAFHANAAASFFLGRVLGRAPGLNLAQALAAEANALGKRPIGDFVPGCVKERMRALELIGSGGPSTKGN